MIRGEIRKNLDADTILSMISEYDIYRRYMPHGDWKINQATNSPFREDNNPSFVIGNKNGQLHHIDFGNINYRGNCFDFVRDIDHLCSFNDVLLKIDKDFGLGIRGEYTGEFKRLKSEYKQPEEAGKRYSLIQVITRKFTQEELHYWNMYYQDVQDLRANNVYSIKSLYLNRNKYPLEEMRFGYLYEGGYWKLYQPFANKKHKWLSNVPLTTTDGLSNLYKKRNALIAKSKKDYLVCRKIYDHVCHVQNESIASFSQETVDYINKNSKKVYVGFDSDAAGKQASLQITQSFNWKHINPPDKLLPAINDFADMAKEEGLDELQKHFIKKGIYN